MVFSSLNSYQQAKNIFGAKNIYLKKSGALLFGRTSLSAKNCFIVLTDRTVKGGTFGPMESKILRNVIDGCLLERLPLVLFLDSGGVRLTEGYEALGSFRWMYKSLLKARLKGLTVISVILNNCFGGASMIATASSYRIAGAKSRLAMTGPKVIAENNDNCSSKERSIENIISGDARARTGIYTLMCDDSVVEYRNSLRELLFKNIACKIDLFYNHQNLGDRLKSQNIQHERCAKLALPKLNSGAPAGALKMFSLASFLIAGHSEQIIDIELNCPSHSTCLIDEELVLSDFISHAALCLAQAVSRNKTITLRVMGQAGGGVFVALSAGASWVYAGSDASFQLLPVSAVSAIVGCSGVFEKPHFASLVKSGVIDKY